MPGLLIAIGNPLRRDDGVAAMAIARTQGDWQRLHFLQLTPEIAADLQGFDRVVFVDADRREDSAIAIEPVTQSAAEPMSHHSTPGAVVELARVLFGFAGDARLCRIPVSDFSFGEGLSPHALAMARRAAELLSAAGAPHEQNPASNGGGMPA